MENPRGAWQCRARASTGRVCQELISKPAGNTKTQKFLESKSIEAANVGHRESCGFEQTQTSLGGRDVRSTLGWGPKEQEILERRGKSPAAGSGDGGSSDSPCRALRSRRGAQLTVPGQGLSLEHNNPTLCPRAP